MCQLQLTMILCYISVLAFQIAFQSKIQGHTNGQYRTGGTTGKDNAATIVFRIVVPIVLYILAALFTRFWYLATKPPWAEPPPPLPPSTEVPPPPPPPPPEEPKEDDAGGKPAPEPDPMEDYVTAYNRYMQQMWEQYEEYMRQYNIPPPPPPEPIKPEQASNVPRWVPVNPVSFRQLDQHT